MKHHDEEQHKAGTGVSLEPIMKNLALAIEQQQQLIVRIPVIPNFNDGPANATAFANLFNQMKITAVELLPFHQFGEKKYTFLERSYPMQDVPQLHSEELDYFKEILEAHQIQCHVQ